MKYILYLFLSIFIICTSCANDTIVEKPRQTKPLGELELQGKEWLETLCDDLFEGRKTGTEGNRLAYEYIFRVLRDLGYYPESQIFETESGTTLRNIIVTIPGLSDSTIIIGAHFDGANQSDSDNHYQAANDNASGTVALMLFHKYIQTNPLITDRTIVCCFWDGEESFEGKAFSGSTYYVQNLPKEMLPFVLHYQNLDTIGHDHDGKNEIFMEYYGDDRIARLAHQISENGRFAYHISESSFFNSDYTSFYKAGVPYLNYHDHFQNRCGNPNHSVSDVKEVISLSRLVKVAYNVCESIETY